MKRDSGLVEVPKVIPNHCTGETTGEQKTTEKSTRRARNAGKEISKVLNGYNSTQLPIWHAFSQTTQSF